MDIRAEKPEDVKAIYQVNKEAFGRENEAILVDQLRGIASTVSLVAVQSDQIVGHLFFSPVTINRHSSSQLLMLGLAPIAILPKYQRQGIGSLLIQRGLETCHQLGCDAVVVLGDPNYYSRFGFVAASTQGLRCEYDAPDDAFMVLELNSAALQDCSGTVQYRSEFKVCE
ncbi:MAG: GNAT family N-acetyltransferase [Leptolyngbya sp.]|nr:MAG: GNAT family N-acetyltransferase [Leptolyngbya sp.]